MKERMAFSNKNYNGTWLNLLPYDIQNEISVYVNHENFSETMNEIVCELVNDIPNTQVLVVGEPTKYQKLLEEVMNLLIEKSSTRILGYISISCISKYTDLYIMKNYRYKSLRGYTIEEYGYELYSYFTHMIVDIFHNNEKNPYNQLIMIKDRMTVLNYQELLDFKNVIKHGLYHMSNIINND